MAKKKPKKKDAKKDDLSKKKLQKLKLKKKKDKKKKDKKKDKKKEAKKKAKKKEAKKKELRKKEAKKKEAEKRQALTKEVRTIDPVKPEPAVKAAPQAQVIKKEDHSSNYKVLDAVKKLRTMKSKDELLSFIKGEKRLTVTKAIPAAMRRLK